MENSDESLTAFLWFCSGFG